MVLLIFGYVSDKVKIRYPSFFFYCLCKFGRECWIGISIGLKCFCGQNVIIRMDLCCISTCCSFEMMYLNTAPKGFYLCNSWLFYWVNQKKKKKELICGWEVGLSSVESLPHFSNYRFHVNLRNQSRILYHDSFQVTYVSFFKKKIKGTIGKGVSSAGNNILLNIFFF